MLTKTMTLFSATLLLAACNSTAQPKPAAPAQSAPAAQSAAAAPIRQAWHLTELSGFKGEIPANAKMDWSKLPTAYAPSPPPPCCAKTISWKMRSPPP